MFAGNYENDVSNSFLSQFHPPSSTVQMAGKVYVPLEPSEHNNYANGQRPGHSNRRKKTKMK